MDIFDIKFWAGTEETLQVYLAALKRVHAAEGSLAKAESYSPVPTAEARVPRLFSKQGDVAVISIKGPLNNSDSWINEFIGAVGYPEIREAMIHAATDPEVYGIVLDINSGGGSVSGMFDTADLIASINAKVKPVHAFADGAMASAAYALGVSALGMTIGRTAEVGSIGVLAVHTDLSKVYADMGINHTLIRSGKFKALGHSVEPLSALAKETIQEQVDKLAGMFNDHVAAGRGTTVALVDLKMGQGRVFIGQDAVDVGLVDGLSGFDDFMSKVRGGIDAKKKEPKYGANVAKGPQLKLALTEQQIAAMAAGTVTAEAEAAAFAVAAAALATVPAVVEPAAEVVKAAPDAVVTLLQTQLAAAQASVVSLSVELHTVKASVDAVKATSEAMRPVVRAAVSTMRVALGGNATGVDALADEQLMAEYANLAPQFSSKFKAGGVAAVSSSAEADNKGQGDVVDPLRQARLAATRNTNQK